MPPSPISGKKILLVAAAIIVVLAGGAGWWMLRSKPRGGAYIDVMALDDVTVVAVRREVTSDTRVFVELVDVSAGSAGMVWQALVPGYRVPEGATGIAASEHAITVRFPREGHTQAFGFASESARKLGTLILGEGLPGEPDGHVGDAVATLSSGNVSYEVLQPDGAPARVYAVSLVDGEIAWWKDLPEHDIVSTWVTDHHLVVVQPGATSALRRDGHVEVIAAGAACVIPGKVDLLVHEENRAIVVTALDGQPSQKMVPLGGTARFAGRCGRRGDAVAALVEDGPRGEVWNLRGDTSTRDDLDAGAFAAIPPATPLADPFAGALDAVVPVVRDTSIIAVDIERGAVVWQTAPAPALHGAVVVDAGAAVLVRAGDLLASFDPATGAARAVRIPDTRPLRAHNVANGVVWVAGDKGLVALDVVTLAPRGTWRTPPAVATASPTDLGLNGP